MWLIWIPNHRRVDFLKFWKYFLVKILNCTLFSTVKRWWKMPITKKKLQEVFRIRPIFINHPVAVCPKYYQKKLFLYFIIFFFCCTWRTTTTWLACFFEIGNSIEKNCWKKYAICISSKGNYVEKVRNLKQMCFVNGWYIIFLLSIIRWKKKANYSFSKELLQENTFSYLLGLIISLKNS